MTDKYFGMRLMDYQQTIESKEKFIEFLQFRRRWRDASCEHPKESMWYWVSYMKDGFLKYDYLFYDIEQEKWETKLVICHWAYMPEAPHD